MFMSSDTSSTSRRTRSNERQTKWDYVKSYYYDPVKWNVVKSIGFFSIAVYLIRDLASNDLLPME